MTVSPLMDSSQSLGVWGLQSKKYSNNLKHLFKPKPHIAMILTSADLWCREVAAPVRCDLQQGLPE